jgi:hypothetical protein
MNVTLEQTVDLMNSKDYKERFVAEYWQTKIRYEKLKTFNTKIEAAKRTNYNLEGKRVEEPKHDCPDDLLREQQHIMGEYLHILEVRAVIEGVDLNSINYCRYVAQENCCGKNFDDTEKEKK